MKYCGNCGKELEEGTMVCPNCGAWQSGAAGSSQASGNNAPAAGEAQKPRKKWKRTVFSLLGGAVAAALIAGGWMLWHQNSPEQRMRKALDAGDHAELYQIIRREPGVDKETLLKDGLLADVEEIKAKFLDGSLPMGEAKEALEAIKKLGVAGVKEELAAAYQLWEKIDASRKNFEKAEEYFEAGDYMEAVDCYRLVVKEDIYYSEALEKTGEAGNRFRQAKLEEAAAYAAEGRYLDAEMTLHDVLIEFPDDKEVAGMIDTYREAYKNQEWAATLAQAEALAAEGCYLEAISELEGSFLDYGDNAEAETKLAAYKDAYAADISAKVQAYLAEKDIPAAKELAREAARELPDNEVIAQWVTLLEQYKTVSLHRLSPINGSFPWGEGVAEDPFGNSYSEAENYAILKYNGPTTVEYKVDEQYDTLSFVVSPYSDFKEEKSSYVQVYVDGVLRYTSPRIYQKTQPLQIANIDISDATYVKIEAFVDYGGNLLISDAMLNGDPEFTSQLDPRYTSLTELDAFNGGFEWNEGYPEDACGSDYTNVQNYAKMHTHRSNTSEYAEYYVNQKYNAIIFDIAPAADFREGYSAVIKVYADDKLVYTSETVTQKTTKFSTGEIGLSGANYVKIVFETNREHHYNIVVVSDILLKNAE